MNNSGIVRADSGTPVKFPGTAVLSESAAPDAGVPATIRVISENGVRRVLTATTDAFSRFTATFLPLPNEAGSYRFAAAHPAVAENVVQGRFELVGMRAEPGGAALRIIPGSPLAGSINLRNLGDVDLTGLSVTVLDAPPNVVLTADLDGDRLPGHGVARLSYTALAADASVSRASARLRVTSAEGASTDLVFELRVEPLAPRLVADEGPLIVGVVRGRQRVVSLQVRNLGGAATGPLRALLPSADLPWLGLASGTTIPSLAPGQSTAVTLTVTPPSDAPLGRYEGTIALRDHPARHRDRERAGEERVDDPRAHPSEALRGRFQNPGLPLQADADLRDPRRLRDIWRGCGNTLLEKVAMAVLTAPGIVYGCGVEGLLLAPIASRILGGGGGPGGTGGNGGAMPSENRFEGARSTRFVPATVGGFWRYCPEPVIQSRRTPMALQDASSDGVCAEVRIQIDQTAVTARSAFTGGLTITNNSRVGGLIGVRLELEFRDALRNLTGDKFVILGPELDGLTAVDGTGVVAPRGSGLARYTFIPTREAAPDGPASYLVSGFLSYIDPESGLEVTISEFGNHPLVVGDRGSGRRADPSDRGAEPANDLRVRPIGRFSDPFERRRSPGLPRGPHRTELLRPVGGARNRFPLCVPIQALGRGLRLSR